MSDQSEKKKTPAPTQDEFIEWVGDLITRVESVDLSANMHWCSQWWEHPEAVARLSALHVQFLICLAEGALSSWWVDHFDRHAAVLFAKRGPFGECGLSHTERGARRALGCEQPPVGWSW